MTDQINKLLEYLEYLQGIQSENDMSTPSEYPAEWLAEAITQANLDLMKLGYDQ